MDEERKSRKARGKLDTARADAGRGLALFHPITVEWFLGVFNRPTSPQEMGWPTIAQGKNTLIFAPTGTGKTLTAFLWCLDRLMLQELPAKPGCRVLYVSPLKALAVDVERNLRTPLAGIASLAAHRGIPFHMPAISVRTGDTPQRERSRFRRTPSDILITTPESLYLILTSEAASALRSVQTVIIDEIHALVSTKRGAHLALSLERLESISLKPLQRIGLSATQRPLEEVAHFLAGAELPKPGSAGEGSTASADAVRRESETEWISNLELPHVFRPVTIVQANEPKRLNLRVEVPVEDMARLSLSQELPCDASQAPKRTSIWSAIHPRLVEIIRERQSTLIFVNSRRLSERLAGAINELAGEPLARAHHGSLAAPQRAEIEESLKAGKIRALVATSSLELGIDMGAIDLVIQIEAPPSVASAMQRVGRAGHQVGIPSDGIIFPKYRADLVACAAVTRAMHEGRVEATRYLRNPLDVLAQQMVAILVHPPAVVEPRKMGHAPAEPQIRVDDLFALVRRAAPFASLSRASFEGVLDMLTGRYPSDEFSDLRPRITWDRKRNILTPREGAKSLAILNAGTIPDRGLYGVFLAGTENKPIRVGELDEEMVFESRTGETFILGASTWRIEEILPDRVLVSPAPGEPGKMPFWHGDSAGRPLEFGRSIGALVRELSEMPGNAGISRLIHEHDLDTKAAENLLHFLADQRISTVTVPDDRNIVIERIRDELGDWRVCVLSPFGSSVHAPWAVAAAERIRAAGGPDVEVMWADDGFVLRYPDTEQAPDTDLLVLNADEAFDLVLQRLGSTALFAAKFREAAGRALLLPRRRAMGRAPLWQQRKRAYDLLSVASRYSAFPMLLEAYRECMRDVFDMPALLEVLRSIQERQVRVHVADTRAPSPFASSLLFSYVANYIYDGDAPLAERRAQALSIDQDQLRDLLGDADLRELLDPDAIAAVEVQVQLLEESQRVRSADGIHDLLLRLGDLSREELAGRVASTAVLGALERLLHSRRVVEVKVAGERRLIAVEDAGRYRDALDIALPAGIAMELLTRVDEPVLELVRRFARTHGPFTLPEVIRRFGLEAGFAEGVLHKLTLSGRVIEGGFRPGGVHREWCDAEVLRLIRRKSLAKLRKEVEPVERHLFARFQTHWQGLVQPRRGLDALLDTVEMLQGVPLPASLLETTILPARLTNYTPADLDTLISAGEVAWRGIEPLGERDGRIALYLADRMPALLPARSAPVDPQAPRERQILDTLERRGALFFAQLHEAVGGGFPGETLDLLWSLVWKGLVTNDAFHALRAHVKRPGSLRPARRQDHAPEFRSRRTAPSAAQGRWAILPEVRRTTPAQQTEWSHAMAQQLLQRYGVVTRESVAQEDLPGGFSAIYTVMKTLEESGRIRRGYFAAGAGATQFALPAAVDLLRLLGSKAEPERPEIVSIAATDPANPYGSILPWPQFVSGEQNSSEPLPRSLARTVGASVILRNGRLIAYLRRGNPDLQVFFSVGEPDRSNTARDLAACLAAQVHSELRDEEARRHGGLLISSINGQSIHQHWFARFLADAGFSPAPKGYHMRRAMSAPAPRDAE